MDKFRLFGGPLDGAEIDAGFVLDGVFRAPMDFKNWRPMPDEPAMPYWRISPTNAEATSHASYRLEGGKLLYIAPRKSA